MIASCNQPVVLINEIQDKFLCEKKILFRKVSVTSNDGH